MWWTLSDCESLCTGELRTLLCIFHTADPSPPGRLLLSHLGILMGRHLQSTTSSNSHSFNICAPVAALVFSSPAKLLPCTHHRDFAHSAIHRSPSSSALHVVLGYSSNLLGARLLLCHALLHPSVQHHWWQCGSFHGQHAPCKQVQI